MPEIGEDREVDVIGAGKIMKKTASDAKDQPDPAGETPNLKAS